MADVAKANFQLQILPSPQWDQWDQFVKGSRQGTIFQTTAYIQAFSEAFQRPAEILAVLRDQEIMGGIVIFPKSRNGLEYATSPYLIPYNGIILRDISTDRSYYKSLKEEQKIIMLLQDELEKRFHYCEISLANDLTDIRSFVWRNWEFIPEYTAYIPLRIDSDPMNDMPHNQRRHIRKSEKENSSFREFTDSGVCYDLMAQSYRHHQIRPPINKTEFENFAKILLERKLLAGYAIMKGAKTLAFMMVIEDKPWVYAMFSGKNFEHEHSGAELYLHWRILQLYREKGYESFDLLGAMSPSISRVKIELGGILKRRDFARFYRHRIIRLLFKIQTFREMKKRRNL